MSRISCRTREAALIMVFRVFERVSYALVMNANRPVHILDTVVTPEFPRPA